MKKRALFCVLSIVCIIFTGCGKETTGTTSIDNVNTAIDNNTVLVCFGDSLTAGYNATTLGQDDKSQSYPAFLQSKLKIQVINAGVTGDTTANGLARIQNDVINKKPAIVIIELGANDFLRGVNVATTKDNLDTIITLLKNRNIKIYLAKFYTDTVITSLPVSVSPALKTAYDTMFNDLKNDHGIDLVEDIWAGVWGTNKMSPDRIHPIASGYQTMADNYFNAIKPYLQEKGWGLLKKFSF